MEKPAPEHVVVLGGGIIGASVAYYLKAAGVRCTIVEREAVGAHASGKAGGFLCRAWGQGDTIQLHEKVPWCVDVYAAIYSAPHRDSICTLRFRENSG